MTTQTYPALYLTPVQAGADGVCTLRRVTLVPGGEPVVVGRIMGFTGDLLPGAHNLYFGSGTLSRKHSEVYLTADNEFMVRDTGSVNGTYVNGHRLSEEKVTSEPVALKTGDTVQFGIDITGREPGGEPCIKVDMKVVCALTAEDAQAAGLD